MKALFLEEDEELLFGDNVILIGGLCGFCFGVFDEEEGISTSISLRLLVEDLLVGNKRGETGIVAGDFFFCKTKEINNL
jgi:hypothetical protein